MTIHDDHRYALECLDSSGKVRIDSGRLKAIFADIEAMPALLVLVSDARDFAARLNTSDLFGRPAANFFPGQEVSGDPARPSGVDIFPDTLAGPMARVRFNAQQLAEMIQWETVVQVEESILFRPTGPVDSNL